MIVIGSVMTILLLWLLLTFYVQAPGRSEMFLFGKAMNGKTALVVYDPDPFYNLDEQLCKEIAIGLSKKEWHVKVATVKAANEVLTDQVDLFIFCANTYNWAPDRAVCNYITKKVNLKDKNVVAFTLGSGSTARAGRLFEELIIAEGANLIIAKQYWLMRPNDEKITTKSNVEIAKESAFLLGLELAEKL